MPMRPLKVQTVAGNITVEQVYVVTGEASDCTICRNSIPCVRLVACEHERSTNTHGIYGSTSIQGMQ